MDHENHKLAKFNIYGDITHLIPIHYSKEKSWSGEIIKDQKTKKIYTILKSGKEKVLVQIDPDTGIISPELSFKLPFIDKIQIYGDQLFLTHSGVTTHQTSKILKRISI